MLCTDQICKWGYSFEWTCKWMNDVDWIHLFLEKRTSMNVRKGAGSTCIPQTYMSSIFKTMIFGNFTLWLSSSNFCWKSSNFKEKIGTFSSIFYWLEWKSILEFYQNRRHRFLSKIRLASLQNSKNWMGRGIRKKDWKNYLYFIEYVYAAWCVNFDSFKSSKFPI